VQPVAGVQHVADDQADGQRDRRHDEEVAERQPPTLPTFAALPDRADAEHDRAEDDRADHHLDQVHEPGAERERLAELGRREPDHDPGHGGADHGQVEDVRAVAAWPLGVVRWRCGVGGGGLIGHDRLLE
jgi:N-acetylmuramoyl-L-alanine amidase